MCVGWLVAGPFWVEAIVGQQIDLYTSAEVGLELGVIPRRVRALCQESHDDPECEVPIGRKVQAQGGGWWMLTRVDISRLKARLSKHPLSNCYAGKRKGV